MKDRKKFVKLADANKFSRRAASCSGCQAIGKGVRGGLPPPSAGRAAASCETEHDTIDAPRDFPLDRLPATRYRCQFAT
ncbi:hypothetical protein [Burkholderia pseudomallei]|uniref:hypothetical protein n=1 Tax=Burkholderia pseudomallei TaxID=28450 RepID=UPI0015867F06|nr:hypothetical protein [Burkholderia pseudomallei]MBF3558499.1 hypothetical protein [Burkholderia pseudomallei]MBF3568414.1 hypothetical protein [Burkholderia pseudomallei]